MEHKLKLKSKPVLVPPIIYKVKFLKKSFLNKKITKATPNTSGQKFNLIKQTERVTMPIFIKFQLFSLSNNKELLIKNNSG